MCGAESGQCEHSACCNEPCTHEDNPVSRTQIHYILQACKLAYRCDSASGCGKVRLSETQLLEFQGSTSKVNSSASNT